jgi:hypothetical protein
MFEDPIQLGGSTFSKGPGDTAQLGNIVIRYLKSIMSPLVLDIPG